LADIKPRDISFKHSLQTWMNYTSHSSGLDDGHLDMIFLLVAQQRVGNRPGRIEPRALKRRPKSYPLLTKSRNQAREEVKKNGHPKKLK